MANEPDKVEFYGAKNSGQIIRYAIADGASVSKYAVLQLLDARTVSSGHLASKPFRIANEEHIAGQGMTSIGCVTQARMTFVASGAIAVGEAITTGGVAENKFISLGLAYVPALAQIGAYSEDTLSDGETGTMRINQ